MQTDLNNTQNVLTHFGATVGGLWLSMQVQLGDVQPWDIPWWIKDLLFATTTLDHKQRFTLVTFLLFNRVQPALVGEWLVVRKLLRDHAARLHVADIMTKFFRGTLVRGSTPCTAHLLRHYRPEVAPVGSIPTRGIYPLPTHTSDFLCSVQPDVDLAHKKLGVAGMSKVYKSQEVKVSITPVQDPDALDDA